jgi:small-conductance mechanosensitive channel
VKPFLVPAIVALAATAALCVIRALTLRLFHKWAEKTEARIDDFLPGSLRTPSLYWCVAIGIYSGVAQGIIKGSILLVGFLVLLSAAGISITPILTALGVGDFIRLETGQEGYVEDITWRTTRVRVLPNNMVIIPGFGDSSLDFTLICQLGEFVDQYLVQHELRKRILRRFRAEGIEIPFPHRTVYMKEVDGRQTLK